MGNQALVIRKAMIIGCNNNRKSEEWENYSAKIACGRSDFITNDSKKECRK